MATSKALRFGDLGMTFSVLLLLAEDDDELADEHAKNL